MTLNAEQIYWQAVRKARIMQNRNVRAMMEGRANYCPCGGDIERAEIIKAIARTQSAATERARP